MIEASKKGEIVLLAKVPKELRVVDPMISVFWLEAMTKGGVKTRGIGVVTKSLAVKTVLSGLGLALKLRERPLPTKAFETLEAALAWAKAL
jgi:hypothetical protein